MIYQFETLDNERFVLNTETLRWGRASSILSAPTVKAAENEITQFVFVEEGDMAPVGGGHYDLIGRTPKTTGPGAGLSTVGILEKLFVDTLIVYIKANVPLKPESLKSNPVKSVKYIVLGDPNGQAPPTEAEKTEAKN